MKVSIRGLAEIAGHEGIVTSRYKDSVGVWTLGIGHTAAAGPPDPERNVRTYTVREIMDLYALDIAKYEARVRRAFGNFPLTQQMFDAAVSFDFNTGGIHRATWVKKMLAGDVAGAKRSFMSWSKPKEIIPRRKAERDLFFDGQYADGFANIYPATKSGRVMWRDGKRVNVLQMMQDKLPDTPVAAPKPAPMQPVAAPPAPAQRKGWLASLLGLIASILRGGK